MKSPKKYLCVLALLAVPLAGAEEQSRFYLGGGLVFALPLLNPSGVTNIGINHAFQAGVKLKAIRIEGEFMKLSLAPERKTLPAHINMDNILEHFDTAVDVAFHNNLREYDAHRFFANVYVDKRLFDRLTVYAGGGVGPSYDKLRVDFAGMRTVIPEITHEEIDADNETYEYFDWRRPPT